MSLLDMDQILMQTAKAVEQMNQPASPGEATREFYRQQGRKQEQERIIALLEPYTICDNACDHYDCTTYGFAESIAIIKGERE